MKQRELLLKEIRLGEYMLTWHERLKQERQSRGWTQSVVAQKIGIHQNTIARWENGHAFPHPYYRKKLTTLFGTNFEERSLLQAVAKLDNTIPQQAALLSERKSISTAVIDDTSVESQVQSAQQELVCSQMSDVQAHEPNSDTSTDHPLLDQPLLELHIQVRGLAVPHLRRFYSQRLLLILSTLLLTILLMSAVLLAFKGVMTSASSSTAPVTTLSGTSYEAEAPGNTLTGAARVADCATCSGGTCVGFIGHASTLQFNNVWQKAAGKYTLTVYYVYGNKGSHRNLHITVNGASRAMIVTVSALNNWNEIGTFRVTVNLNVGNNTISFSNPWGVAPNIDRIVLSRI